MADSRPVREDSFISRSINAIKGAGAKGADFNTPKISGMQMHDQTGPAIAHGAAGIPRPHPPTTSSVKAPSITPPHPSGLHAPTYHAPLTGTAAVIRPPRPTAPAPPAPHAVTPVFEPGSTSVAPHLARLQQIHQGTAFDGGVRRLSADGSTGPVFAPPVAGLPAATPPAPAPYTSPISPNSMGQAMAQSQAGRRRLSPDGATQPLWDTLPEQGDELDDTAVL